MDFPFRPLLALLTTLLWVDAAGAQTTTLKGGVVQNFNPGASEIPPRALPYQRFGLGDEAKPSDFFAARNGNDMRGFPATREYWEGMAAEVEFQASVVTGIRLLPLDLGFNRSRPQRGRPVAKPAIVHFADAVSAFNNYVAFAPLRYSELLDCWTRHSDHGVQAHGTAMLERFDI